jgi:uncharacterized protein
MDSGGLTVRLRVRPGASRTVVGGRHGDEALVVAVGARAVAGRANQAVIEAVAAAFGVRRSAVSVLVGQRSRDKVLFVVGEPDTLRARLVVLRGS